jgi:hypothetical protein
MPWFTENLRKHQHDLNSYTLLYHYHHQWQYHHQNNQTITIAITTTLILNTIVSLPHSKMENQFPNTLKQRKDRINVDPHLGKHT